MFLRITLKEFFEQQTILICSFELDLDFPLTYKSYRVNGCEYQLFDLYHLNSNSLSLIDQSLVSEGNEHKKCVICFLQKVNSLILPCRHFAVCFNCSKELQRCTNKCPLCRTEMKRIVLLYND